MSSPLPRPFFPLPPDEYRKEYFSEIVRAFSVYVEQQSNPGPIVGSELNLEPNGADGLKVFADNAAAKTGGLKDGDVYRTSTGDLKIVYT